MKVVSIVPVPSWDDVSYDVQVVGPRGGRYDVRVGPNTMGDVRRASGALVPSTTATRIAREVERVIHALRPRRSGEPLWVPGRGWVDSATFDRCNPPLTVTCCRR